MKLVVVKVAFSHINKVTMTRCAGVTALPKSVWLLFSEVMRGHGVYLQLFKDVDMYGVIK